LRAAVLLFALLAVPVAPALASPTVVELYQSQGCSSCPPAIANINALADDPQLLVLDFAVTYWDNLGWKDTFARPEYTKRQWDYAHGLRHGNVYTPQVVVAGHRDLAGTDPRELRRAVDAAKSATDAPSLSLQGNMVSIGSSAAPAQRADVWLVRYDPRIQNVAIGAGENGGATIAHKNIVREVTRLGTWNGKPEQFRIMPAPDSTWRNAILVQGLSGGEILAAAKS
jgi:hypothetical protein